MCKSMYLEWMAYHFLNFTGSSKNRKCHQLILIDFHEYHYRLSGVEIA